MGLIGNGSPLNKGGALKNAGAGVECGNPGNFHKSGPFSNRSWFFNKYASHPIGYAVPAAFKLAQKSGGIGSTNSSTGTITPSASMAAGRNLSGSSTMTITLTNAQLDQIVSLVLSGSLSMSVTSAILAGAANLDADGTMTITASSAICGAIVSSIASSSMSISGTGTSFLTALANMEAEAGGPTPLSPEGLAAAVWDAVLADYQNAGSAGEALSDAGGAGNPWSALLASNADPGTFGERVQQLLKTSVYIGTKG